MTWAATGVVFLGSGRGVDAKRCTNCEQAAFSDLTAVDVLASEELLLLAA